MATAPPQYAPVAPPPVCVPLMPQAMVVQPVGPKPCTITCRTCGSQVITKIEMNASSKTHTIALICCLFGCWLGCCLIPYCMDSCQNIDHYCPACNAYIGTYSS